MVRLWLIFAQAVTVALAILFVVSALRPDLLRLHAGALVDGDTPAALPQPAASPSPSPSATVTQLGTGYANAVARAAPAVVNVYTTKTIKVPDYVMPNDAMMRKFFGLPPLQARPRQSTSLGSGVVVHSDGYVLTNYHVVEAADAIEVALADGRTYSAKLVGADPDTDLAVLRLPDQARDVPVATVAREQPLAVGDVVLAIGNPFGVGQTTTQGIVSALGRNRLGINTYENFIQTDAAINPGNSGGALVNALGELVGINTAIYSPPGGAMGIGFAIPVQAAEKVMEAIIRDGRVERGWLGVEPQDMTSDLARSFGLKDRRGVVIAGVLRQGPAARAGLRVGDIVRSVEGVAVSDTTSMLSMVAALPPGHNAVLGVMREGQLREIKVKVGVRPARPLGG